MTVVLAEPCIGNKDNSRIVHALRGWPTLYGTVLNGVDPLSGADGTSSSNTRTSLDLVATAGVRFARRPRSGLGGAMTMRVDRGQALR